MEQDQPVNTTPPGHPLHGLELSDETISKIVAQALRVPLAYISVSRLPHGQSFNNRIYFIDVEGVSGHHHSYVLKVNGKYFDAQKIENEVACLLALDHFCPELPVPKVVAWSLNGSDIAKRNLLSQEGNMPDVGLEYGNITSNEADALPGWILMTKLPGKVLDLLNLGNDETSHMVKQIASILLSWRRNISKSMSAGDLRLHAPSPETADRTYYYPSFHFGHSIYNYGVVGSANSSTTPMSSVQEFWESEIRSQMKRLGDMEIFAPNRETVLPLMERFLEDVLPKLAVCNQGRNSVHEGTGAGGSFTFTHTDFAPRNILVSDSSPSQVTGVVDFEFAGFLPQFEEFVAMYLGCKVEEDIEEEGGDWPPKFYRRMLEEMELQGEKTVLSLRGTREWSELKCLESIRMQVAPWWLAQMDNTADDGGEVGVMLEAAKQEIELRVAELRYVYRWVKGSLISKTVIRVLGAMMVLHHTLFV